MNLYGRGDLRRIAVSQRLDCIQSRGEQRDALDLRLTRWLGQVGALTFPVPNGLLAMNCLSEWLLALAPQAIVLSGGNDVGSHPERDRTEGLLLDYAADRDLPVLGICRGMQMMAHREGIGVEDVVGHVGTIHPLISDAGDCLPETVNSFHNKRLATCPANYRILATAPDGGIEGIRHRERNWEGWMWHPERNSEPVPSIDERARKLLWNLGLS